jgi:hypothetical protein
MTTEHAAHVYRAFDAAGRLLYVGCSIELDARLRQHSQNAQWWLFKDRVVAVGYPTHQEALDAEAEAIATEHPRWNMQGRSPDHPDGKASSWVTARWLDYDRDVANRHRKLLAEEQRLLSALRKVRMGLQGVRLEADAIKNGFTLDDEEIAS